MIFLTLQNSIVPKILESNLPKQIKLETKDTNENVVSDLEQTMLRMRIQSQL
jgi:hypothetical protein